MKHPTRGKASRDRINTALLPPIALLLVLPVSVGQQLLNTLPPPAVQECNLPFLLVIKYSVFRSLLLLPPSYFSLYHLNRFLSHFLNFILH